VHALVAAVAATHGAVGWLTVPDRPEVDAWLDDALAASRVVAAYDGDRLLGLGTWGAGTPTRCSGTTGGPQGHDPPGRPRAGHRARGHHGAWSEDARAGTA
jgi:hypothetical protein